LVVRSARLLSMRINLAIEQPERAMPLYGAIG